MLNSRDIKDLQPYVRYLAQQLIDKAKAQGLRVLVTSTLRDKEYQAYLYAQGRTRSGQIVTNLRTPTAHGSGLAFDVCQNIRGKEWDISFFNKIGKIGVSLGLEWGGNWKSFIDRPHFQYVQGLTNTQIRAGRLPNFPPIPKSTGGGKAMEKSWQQEIGEKAVKELSLKNFINNPDNWIKMDLENAPVPLWLFFEMCNRIINK